MTIFLVIVLGVWRLSALFATEYGPADIFIRFRIWLGVRVTYDVLSRPVSEKGTNFISDLILCIWCNSVWIGALTVIAWLINREVTFYVIAPFAVSGGAVLLDSIIRHEGD